jgi:ABC-2 type transport system permease protein
MSTFLILLNKEIKEQSRSKRLLILGIVFLFVAISSAIMAKLLPQIINSAQTEGITIHIPEPTYKDAIDQFVKNIGQLSLFVFVFVVAGAIADEKNKKTLELLFAKPISRGSFVLAKFIAYFLTIGVFYAVAAFIFYFYTVNLFGHFDLFNFLLMAKLALIYVLLIVSATIFSSSISGNSIIAAILGFVAMIIFGTIIPLINSIKKYAPYELMNKYKDVSQNGWSSDLWIPLIVTLALIVIFVLATIFIVKNQEVER